MLDQHHLLLFTPLEYGYLTLFWSSIPFMSIYHAKTFTQVSKWFKMILTQIRTRVYKDSHLDIPTIYQYVISITILYPHVGSAIPYFDVDY